MAAKTFVVLGAPGAGKGTQAVRLAERLGVAHLSTGDILRDAAKRQTPLGREAKGYMDRGALVADEVVVGIVREALSRPECREGCILDGFPRTLPQAEALETALGDDGAEIGAVVYLRVGREEAIRRLTARRSCPQCGATYHLLFQPPRREGRCDSCGAALVQREDDDEETVRRRLRVYEEETAPLIDYYRRAGKLVEVDGEGPIGRVFESMLDAVGRVGSWK